MNKQQNTKIFILLISFFAIFSNSIQAQEGAKEIQYDPIRAQRQTQIIDNKIGAKDLIYNKLRMAIAEGMADYLLQNKEKLTDIKDSNQEEMATQLIYAINAGNKLLVEALAPYVFLEKKVETEQGTFSPLERANERPSFFKSRIQKLKEKINKTHLIADNLDLKNQEQKLSIAQEISDLVKKLQDESSRKL